jgi:exopolyphosphatase / guanosine-5'-triphosphate,3'-diphosphate pyrophosphatase
MALTGIVDLGSSNARMVVYEHEPGEWFRLVDVIREPVRLGEGLGSDGRMTAAAIERGLAALDLFVDYAAATGLDRLEVIGTSALRDAKNRDAFTRAADPLGVEIQVLSGEDEARRGVLAVANGFDLDDAWVIDLGGGSAQVSRMGNRRFQHGEAYPLGGVRLTEAFLANDPPRRTEVRALEVAVDRTLARLLPAIRADEAPLVAMGGTVRNLARAAQRRTGYPLDVLHGYALGREALDEIVAALAPRTSRQRARMPGIHPERADVILGGALVFRRLLKGTGRKEILVSGHGVREGTFYRQFLPAPHRIKGLRTFSIHNLVARYGLASPHTEHVRLLASRLFRGLAPLHGLGKREAELLDAAACLHDLGITVDFYRHQRHGAYMLGVDALPGFSHREHVLLMLLIRYHHGNLPRLIPYETLAAPGDKRLLARLATCLRLAESLERSRAGRVQDLAVEIRDQAVVLRLVATENPAVELWETAKHGDLFERAFGKQLVLATQS